MQEKSNPFLNVPPLITVYGNESIRIENIKGIQGFTSDGIAINTSCGLLFARGESLLIQSFEDGIVTISGKICSVSYV